jgi:hypothetical protein
MVSGAAADTNMNTMSRVPIAFFFNPAAGAEFVGGTVAAA